MLRNKDYELHQRAVSLAGGGDLAVSDCRTCGHAIAWATSKRTGKRYPCNVYPKQGDNFERALRATPWDVHTAAVCKRNQEIDAQTTAQFEGAVA